MTEKTNIPQGYKDSPLGIIPKEWEVKRLGDCTRLLTNGFVGVATPHYTDDPDGITYIQGFNVTEGGYNLTGIKKVTKEFHKKNSKSSLQDGDLLTIQTGDIGLTTIVPKELEGSNCHALIISRFKEGILPRFMLYYYNSTIGRHRFHIIETGSTMKHINTGDLYKFYVPVPPIEEQKIIIAIASLWDTAIEKQSELIEKLKLRKRALMQQLLTVKKRLPGFCGEWKEVKLGDVFDERNETNRDDLPLLSITGDKGVIYQSDSDKRDISNDDKSKYKRICPNDIGYNTMRMWQGRSALSELEGIVSPAYTIVTPRESINVKFMSMLIQQPRVVYDFWTHSQGLVSDTLNCKYPDFCQVKVRIPTEEEQTAIASVLVKADKEIELAKEKLANLQSQKRGLMQQLLTGKKRIN